MQNLRFSDICYPPQVEQREVVSWNLQTSNKPLRELLHSPPNRLERFLCCDAIQAAKSLLLLLALENPVIYRIFPEMSSESADISLKIAFFALALLKWCCYCGKTQNFYLGLWWKLPYLVSPDRSAQITAARRLTSIRRFLYLDLKLLVRHKQLLKG